MARKKDKVNISDLSKLALSTLESNNKKRVRKDNPLELYIGKSENAYEGNTFNIAAAMLNCSYFVYHKLYIVAIILAALIIGLKVLISDNLIFVSIYVVICAACGVLFNKKYIEYAKKKVEKLKIKYPDEKQYKSKLEKHGKKNIILPTIVEILIVGAVSMIILEVKLAAIITALVGIFNSITTTDYKFLKMNSESFVNIVENYSETAVLELENPGEYTYKIKNKKYDIVAIPYNSDQKDIACTYKNGKWSNDKKYEFSPNSSTCEKYFKDIFNNYAKDYDMSTIDSAEIIITYKGKIANKSYLKYNDVKCEYHKKDKQFKCSK